MTRYIRFALLLTFGMFAWVAVASADSISLSAPCGPGCQFSPGVPAGAPASGMANFFSIDSNIAFEFETAEAVSFILPQPPFNPPYMAAFGPGGSFDFAGGPGGLIFQGEMTSGTSFFVPDLTEVSVDFSGEWSNGVPGNGEASFERGFIEQPINSVFFTVTLPPVPEPSSFVLFGTGAIGLGVLARRRRHSSARPTPFLLL